MLERRPITPAEAILLLAPSNGTATRCIQAGLLSLLGANRITFEPVPGPFRQSTLLINAPTAETNGKMPAHLVALEQALLAYGKGNRLTNTEVVQTLQSRFGLGYGHYLRDEVAPALIKRNLLTRADAKWFGIFPRVTYARTPAGDAMAAPLQRMMLAIEKLSSMIATDPEQALALAQSAGVLLIMSPKARRQIPKLRRLLAKRGEVYTGPDDLPLQVDREFEWELMLDLGDMALAFDVAALFDGIEAVGEFTDGSDGGCSDGGDGGGGGD